MSKSHIYGFKELSRQFSLRIVLTVPFVLQIVSSTALVGYFSYQNGQQAVNDLANQLMAQASDRVDQHLDSYLAIPQQINQINQAAIDLGLLDLKDLDNAGHYFWKQIQVYDVSFIGYALETGEYIGSGRWLENQGITIDEINPATSRLNYTYATDELGQRTEIVAVYEDYAPLTEPWYVNTIQAQTAQWGEIYNWDATPEYVSISADLPIYDATQRPIGVLSVDLLLSTISDFLRQLEISPSSQVFIIERDGSIVASSDSEQPFQLVDGVARRLKVQESDNMLIRAGANYLQEQFGSFNAIQTKQASKFLVQNRSCFIQVTPWHDQYGLDWIVVTVFPERDFMAQVNQNTRNTILLCLATLLIAIQVGIWTARWITKPIFRLNRAAKAIAEGELIQTIQLNRHDELGELAQSFNNMAIQLYTSFSELQSLNAALTESEQQLQHYNQTLEQQVRERTQELSDALEQLQVTQADLIQAEKLAALGQLIAGIAHEINTPLGAIQASIGNIDHALRQSLQQMPEMFQTLSVDHLTDFFTLLDAATTFPKLLSAREERQLRRRITQTLTEQGVEQASAIADRLSKMGVVDELDALSSLLHRADVLAILDTAYALSSVHTNSQNIQLAVERAAKIVFALKHYIRQDYSECKVKATISEGIDTVLTLYHNQLKHGIEVVKRYDPIPLILCYPDALIQVWSNLIMNAVQAMNYQGRLTIEIVQEQQVIVRITDSGSGIPPEIRDRIFTPFFTTKPIGEGSGLGLHIVRQIVEKHDGYIRLISEPGCTTFEVYLPIL